MTTVASPDFLGELILEKICEKFSLKTQLLGFKKSLK